MNERADVIADHIARHLPSQASLLEIGAGKGLVAEQLQKVANADIKLVDVVDYNQTDLELKVYDGSALPFPVKSFDYSLLVFVLHHTPDPLPVLTEALRVSRKGVIVVENHVEGRVRRAVTRFVDSIPHWQYGVPVCYRTLTKAEWLEIFSRLPVRAEAVDEFSMGRFWQNFIVLLKK